MSKSAANVRSGPADLFFAAEGQALPEINDLDTGIVTTAAMVAASFTELGYTEDGVSVEFEVEVFKHEVNEALGPIGGTISKISALLKFTLAESNVDHLLLALGAMTKSTVAAAANQSGQNILYFNASNVLGYKRFVALAKTAEGYSDLWAFWKVAPEGSVGVPFKKGEKTVVPITLGLYEDPAASDAKQRFFARYSLTAVPTS